MGVKQLRQEIVDAARIGVYEWMNSANGKRAEIVAVDGHSFDVCVRLRRQAVPVSIRVTVGDVTQAGSGRRRV